MSIFETNSTPDTESPEIGHEEVAAEQYEEQEYEQEVEQEEVPTEEEETDPTEDTPELLAGKYKSVEDLAKGYKELERAFHQRNKPTQEPIPQEQPKPNEQRLPNFSDPNDIIDAINRDPVGTIAQIAQMAYNQAKTVETKEQQFENGLKEVSESYRDQLQSEENLHAFYGKVAEISRELGVDPRNPSPRILRMAADELWQGAKTQTKQQLYDSAKQAARAEVQQTRQAKQGLSAPTGAKPKETPKTAEDLIADSIVSAGRRNGIWGN